MKYWLRLRKFFSIHSEGQAPLLSALWVWGTIFLLVGLLASVPALILGHAPTSLVLKLGLAATLALAFRRLSFPKD